MALMSIKSSGMKRKQLTFLMSELLRFGSLEDKPLGEVWELRQGDEEFAVVKPEGLTGAGWGDGLQGHIGPEVERFTVEGDFQDAVGLNVGCAFGVGLLDEVRHRWQVGYTGVEGLGEERACKVDQGGCGGRGDDEAVVDGALVAVQTGTDLSG